MLPRQAAAQEFDQRVCKCLQIITPTQFNVKPRRDASVEHVTRSTSALGIRNVCPGLLGHVLLRSPEVNEIDGLAILSHNHICRLDVAMKEELLVHHLDASDELVSKHEDRLGGDLAPF